MILIGFALSPLAYLIFYHIGMFYVSWGWHVKSVHAGEALEPAMRLLNPWRLALLFFISGLALRFAIDKAKLGSFTRQRTLRLLIPILFGMFVIVVPQAYLQLVETGEFSGGYSAFYLEYLKASTDYSVILPTWNHLWYIVYLMLYTLVLVPIARPLARFMTGRGAQITQKIFGGRFGILGVMLTPVLSYLIYRVFLDPYFPTTHDVINDWANHAHSLTMLLTGFILAKDKAFWGAVERALKPAFTIAISLGLILSLVWMNWDAVAAGETWLWPARFAKIIYAWVCILTLLGAAQKWLNRPSRALSYMTEAIFPWYILHQTITVVAGYFLTRQGLSFGIEFIFVTFATFAGCALLHEFIIRRTNWIRPLFGLKRITVKP